MNVTEIIEAGLPQWLIAAAVIVGLVGTLSEKAGALAGPLGAPSRWWHARQERAEEELDAAVEARLRDRLPAALAEAMAHEREWAEAALARADAAITRLSEDHRAVSAEVDRLRRDLEEERGEFRVLAEWSQDVREWYQAHHGSEWWRRMPPPRFPGLPQHSA